ncbi:MAG: VacB/RNase II family 3'-5' exoribonuclease [Desulfobulbaceae bacterium]|nr:VacB/RNase II family 3'-5' exoribonuclease [Desulfobulbaceae bacterium]
MTRRKVGQKKRIGRGSRIARNRSQAARHPAGPHRKSELDGAAEEIVGFLTDSGGSASLDEIMEGCGVSRKKYKEFTKRLKDLCALRVLARAKGKRYSLLPQEESDLLEGTLSMHPKGFGFVSVENPPKGVKLEKDVFISPRALATARHGDRVQLQIIGGRRDRKEGRIVRIVERSMTRLVGIYIDDGPAPHVVPEDEHFTFNIVISKEDAATAVNGDAVVAEITEYREGERNPKGRIREVLGDPNDVQVQTDMVLHKYRLPYRFDEKVEQETAAMDTTVAASPERLDLRELPLVTIDGEDARDFDDAVAVEKTSDGYRLYVSIADVSHYVRPGTSLDQEAYQRGTSVYFPTRVVPMLPEKLSNNLCSLVPDEDRLAFSAILDFDTSGKRIQQKFAKSIIRSRYRLTYTVVKEILVDGDKKAIKQHQPIVAMLTQMAELEGLLETRRMKRGSIGFEIPEAGIEVAADGTVGAISRRERNLAHKIVEEFMLAANREVARLLLRQGQATLFRHHPEPADMSGVWDALKQLGAATGKERSLPRAVGRAVADGYGPAVSAAMLRCMPQACYTTRDATHFNLGFEAYTHFTSPIRRYADLVVHRILHGMLDRRRGVLKVGPIGSRVPAPVHDEALESLGEHVTDRGADADRAESRIRRRRVLEFLLRLGNVPTEGQVTLVVDRGLLVDLPEYGTSGLLPVDMLPGGPFQVEHGVLRGKDRSFRLGETLDVCIHRIDPVSSKLDLALAPQF